MCGRVVGVQFYGPPKLLFGSIPVPIVILYDQRERGVCFREAVIQFQRPQRGRARLWHVFRSGRYTVTRRQRVAVRQAGVGWCVSRIFADGLSEIFDGLLKARQSSFVPEKQSF